MHERSCETTDEQGLVNMLNKLVTALRGGLNDAGEALADSQALRILDQELRDASEELNQTRASLAALMAQHKLSEKRVAMLQAQISEHECYALKALEISDESLAHDVAIQIADLESAATTEQANSAVLCKSVEQVRQVTEQASRELKILKQQLSTLRASQSVHRAQATLSARYEGTESRLQTAKDSLARLQERQEMQSHTLAASQEIEQESKASSLDERLKAAGIKPDVDPAEAVLDRLKERHRH